MRCLVLMIVAAAIMSAQKSSSSFDNRLSSTGLLEKRAIQSGIGPKISLTGCFNTPDCDDQPVNLSSTQAETTIAVDSTGQHIVIGFNDFRGFFVGPQTSISGFIYSDDGGNTFVDGGQLPVGPTTSIGGDLYPQLFGDPDVKYLGGCNFVYASLMTKGLSGTGLVGTLGVSRSSDCGHTWSAPVEVPAATNPNAQVDVNGNAVDFADKELADVDPDTNRYELCWSNFSDVIEISCSYSDNILALNPTFSGRSIVSAKFSENSGSAIRFAGNGSPNAYIAWSRYPGTLNGYSNNIAFARSTDNGMTWSAPITITSDFLTMDYVLGNDRVNTFPSLAVDKSPGPFSGNVYVVYSNNNSLDGADVMFQKSTNQGVSFSPAVALNSRPGADRAQWFPYVTVDRTTGRVWVFYYDQGVATSGDRTEVTYLYSDNGGASWSKPAPLTPSPFKAGWGNDTGQPNLGDYNQAVAQFGNLYAAYAATTQPKFTDGQPLPTLNTPDVFFSKVSSATVQAPLHVGAFTFTDSGGDGNIDPGDVINLKIPLQNYDINPLSAGTVGGISATLSTTTPGVTVTQAVSAYPAISPGATATNATDFVLRISSAFVPGTPIQLSLAVTSAGGSATVLLTLQSGTPVYTTLLNETFDPPTSGAGWTAVHGAGTNTVPWTLTNFAPSVCGPTIKAFHQNANDGANPAISNARWERLVSPLINVPAASDYVTLDFDVCYDTEDDPVLRVLAYDGLFLRVTDQTPGRTLRSVLAEAFEEEFTTDGFEHYPKHLPRNSDPNYFEDMSVWAGFSNGTQHVHMKLPGMAGSRFQLRFEYTQDEIGTCADLRPGHACGVSIDNVVVRSVASVAPITINLEARHTLSRDPVTDEILDTVTVTNTGSGTAQNVQLTSATLGGVAPSNALPNLGAIPAGGSATAVLRYPASAAAHGATSIVRITGTYTGGTFTVSTRVLVP